jgi:ketosteroid isomerase-like protein
MTVGGWPLAGKAHIGADRSCVQGESWQDNRMPTADPILGLMDRFTAAINAHDLEGVLALVTEDIVFESTSPAPDGTRYQGRAAVARVWADLLAATPRAQFAVEEQFSDGAERAVVRWRYDWGDGHVRGVDIIRVRDGRLAESLAYVKG